MINNTTTPNDIMISLVSDKTNDLIFSEAIYFWIAALILFTIVYLALSLFTELSKTKKAMISLIIPVIMDLSVSFGSFTFTIPVLNLSLTITHGILFITLLDSIMRYEIFAFYSNPILGPFIESAPEISTSIIITVFAWLSAFSDSILEFIFFYFVFYTIISLIEDYFGKQTPYQIPIALVLTGIPVIGYAMLVSDPFRETIEITKNINGIAAFMSAGNGAQIIMILLVFLINFIIISGIMLAIVELFLLVISKVNPSTETLKWEYDFTGIAIVYTVSYSLIFLLHSSYNWYVIIPFLFFTNILKSKGASIINNVKDKMDDKNRMSQVATLAFEKFTNARDGDSVSTHRSNDIIPTFLVVLVLIISITLIYMGMTGFKI